LTPLHGSPPISVELLEFLSWDGRRVAQQEGAAATGGGAGSRGAEPVLLPRWLRHEIDNLNMIGGTSVDGVDELTEDL
jgi:hypothetical protein